jgi:hypothetical protein
VRPSSIASVLALICTIAYQTEIDNLTKRSKVSENAFLNAYKVLAEAPDPYPLLEAAVVRSISYFIEKWFTYLRRPGPNSQSIRGKGT